MKRLILLLLLSSLISVADAQMITVADFNARIGKTITSTSYSTFDADTIGLDAKLTALVGMTGTGQTWDFSSIVFATGDQATSITRVGISGAVGAEDPKLASATHTAETTNETTPGFRSWTFYTLAGDILYTNGVTADSLGTLIYKIVNDPAAIEFKFPVQYGASWTAQTSNSLIDIGGETINREQRKEVTIDGAGTLIVPGQAGVPAIRMKSVTYGKTGPYLTLYFYDTATFYSVISTDGAVNASISPSRPSPIPGGPSIPGSASYSFGTVGTVNQDVTDPPQLTSPADGATITATEATLEWGTVAKATSYNVQVSQTADFQTTLHNNSISGTSTTYSLVPGIYYWRVAGVSAESKIGPLSGVRSFTMMTSGVKEENLVFTLEPNHPNPVATETKIGYTLNSDAHVGIIIHDQFGNKVATLVDGVEYRGSHIVTFDARHLASGQYYYTLTAGGHSMTMPMTIVK